MLLPLLPFRLVAGDRSTVTGVTAPIRRVTHWFIQQTLVRGSVFAIGFGSFSRIKNASYYTVSVADLIWFETSLFVAAKVMLDRGQSHDRVGQSE